MLSAVDEETVKTQKFTRLQAAADTGRISNQEYRDAANKGNLFDITLDTTESALNPDDPEAGEIVKEGENKPAKPISDRDPGSNREDSKKGKASPDENKRKVEPTK